jgi:predicted dehydrogenase
MNLTPELKELGRRNFLQAVAGSPSWAALASGAAPGGPKRGGPVKAALIGVGGEGKVLLGSCQKSWIDLRALCDINPQHASEAADGLTKTGWARPRVYQDFKEMLAKEDLEAIIIATPLFTHADITVACLEAGKHVLCEKMMAWDLPSCRRMAEAARKSGKLLEIGYQRFYSPIYPATHETIIKDKVLGDIHYVRNVWHRSKTWRRTEAPPSADFDPRPWGYDSWDHLLNWRLFRKYSRGLMAELGSHQMSIANWFLGNTPQAVFTSGGVHRFKEGGREAFDHVYATFDYPGGVTATFTSIESNAFDSTYEMFTGTKGTLMLMGNGEAYLWREGEDSAALASALSPPTSKDRPAAAGGALTWPKSEPRLAYKNEIIAFCSAVRSGTPLRCGPEKAQGSAAACIRGEEAGFEKARLTLV